MSKIKKDLDAKIRMFKALATLYLSYMPRLDVIPALAALMTVFRDRNDAIDVLVPKASENTKPTTAQRNALKSPLYISAAVVAQAVCAYADSIDDLVLKGTMNWTPAKLAGLPFDQLGPACEAIHTKGTELQEQSEPFGLTKEKLAKLNTETEAWMVLESGTRNKQVAITGHKRQLAKVIAENMKLLTGRLDGMVFTLSDSDPEIVGIWDQTRTMVPLPTTPTQAKVVVKIKMTDLFVYAAEVQLVNGLVNKAITNVSGEAEFKPIKEGLYLFKVVAPGFKPYEVIQQRLYRGRINRFDVGLEPE